MIKDKLHSISDTDAETVARLLLVSNQPYIFSFDKITRWKYDTQEGCDAEETVNVYFHGKVSNEVYRTAGWKDIYVMVKLVECDRYHNYPHFTAEQREPNSNPMVYTGHFFISNHIEAIEFLKTKELI